MITPPPPHWPAGSALVYITELATNGGLFGMDGNDEEDEDEDDILWGLALLPHSLL